MHVGLDSDVWDGMGWGVASMIQKDDYRQAPTVRPTPGSPP